MAVNEDLTTNIVRTQPIGIDSEAYHKIRTSLRSDCILKHEATLAAVGEHLAFLVPVFEEGKVVGFNEVAFYPRLAHANG